MLREFVLRRFIRKSLSILLTASSLFLAPHAVSAGTAGACAASVAATEPAKAQEALIQQLVRIEDDLRERHAYELIPKLEELSDRVLAADGAADYKALAREVVEFGRSIRTTGVVVAPTSAATSKGKVTMSRDAQKELEKLPAGLALKAKEIMDEFEAEGRGAFDHWRNGGRQFEKLHPGGNVGEHTYSVRLNRGFRLIFILKAENEIEVIYLNSWATHRGT